jgi:chaperonin GroES
MSIKIRPLNDRVVVSPIEEDEVTFAGGMLVLPDSAKEKPQQGKVLAIGPEVNDEEEKNANLNIGDIVIYAKYSGTTFKTRDGQELLILRVDDILGVVE